MSLSFYNTDYSYALENLMKFGDFGISLITLDNGDTIAVNTIEDIEIKDGDIVVIDTGAVIGTVDEYSVAHLDNEAICKELGIELPEISEMEAFETEQEQ